MNMYISVFIIFRQCISISKELILIVRGNRLKFRCKKCGHVFDSGGGVSIRYYCPKCGSGMLEAIYSYAPEKDVGK